MGTTHSSHEVRAGHEQPIDIKAYWRALRRRRWLVASFFLTTLLLAIVVTVRQTRIYDATCTIVIELNAPKVLDKQVEDVVEFGTGAYWLSKEYYETQYKVIQSRAVAARVVDKLHLADNLKFLELDTVKDPELRQKKRAKLDPVALAQASLRVEPVKDSRIVRLRVEHPDARLAAEIANAFADAYMEENLAVKFSTTKAASKWLEDQLHDLEAKLDKSSRALYEFKKAHDIVSTSWEDKQSMVSQRLVALNEALTKTRTQKAQLQSRSEAVEAIRRSAANDSTQELADALQAVAASEIIQKLRIRYLDVKTECAEMKERYLESHPKLVACAQKLDLAGDNLQQGIRNVLNTAQAEYSEVTQTEKHLVEMFNQAKDEAFSMNQHEPEYAELKRSFDNNQRLYDLVLKRLKEAGLSGMLQMSNVRILDSARFETNNPIPIRPQVKLNLLIAMLIGLIGGLGLAFFVETLDSSITSQEQIEERFGLTFLGIIPRVDQNKDAELKDLFVNAHPKSAGAECCRSIRTNILFMSPDKPLKTILVTSSGPEEGKTITAVSLALTMAENGGRVLLVDADMRRPRIHRAFGLANGNGLSSLILGEGKIEDCVKSTAMPNLGVLTCGPVPPNPAELLQTEAFGQLLKKLSDRFDRIIIDSPPVGVVVDAVVASTQVDGTVFVLKMARTSREMARKSIRTLRDVNARIFGAVLNDVDLKNAQYGDYQYHGYGYYYGAKEAA